MRKMLLKENINTKEYLDNLYSKPDWKDGGRDIEKRIKEEIDLIGFYKNHLDVGCADGDFTRLYLDRWKDAIGTGIDISQEIILQARQKSPQGYFQPANLYEIPFDDRAFDLVHCAEVIEHLEYPKEAIIEMWRVLKEGGDLVLTTINEKAADYEEHLWKWDLEGVVELLRSFKIINKKDDFFNGHMIYIRARKV